LRRIIFFVQAPSPACSLSVIMEFHLLCHPNMPIKSAHELVAATRDHPAKVLDSAPEFPIIMAS
jgi:hypothetical protein